MKGAALVFLAFGSLYVATLPPALAPYRDAGEMTSSAHTLGVSHPTGYPLYILLGRAAQSVPIGNKAYRLGLLSALAGAAAVAVLFAACAGRFGFAPALAAVLFLGLNYTHWSVSLVTEMYSLNLLAASLLWLLALSLRDRFDARLWLAFAGLYGLALSNRMDILLWAPGLLWLIFSSRRTLGESGAWAGIGLAALPVLMTFREGNWPLALFILATAFWLVPGRRIWPAGLIASAGLALYLYLPVRSAALPWLDWNHPAQWANFLESVLRTKYGGTLDLLSRNYAPAQMFADNMIVYGRHLWENFHALGLACALCGLAAGAREDFRGSLGEFAVYWWSGPVFILLGNLPPNPHAMAIVEPHYLLSDFILAFWAARGAARLSSAHPPLAFAAALLAAAVPLARGRWGDAQKRDHFFTYDFARNVFLSAPRGAVAVAKKDVPLYTLWHYQAVQGWRPDLRLVSQGLSGAAWYQAGWRRQDPSLALSRLSEVEDWRRLAAANGPSYATIDCETMLPGGLNSSGLLTAVASPALEPWLMMARRGDYDYDRHADFFTSDVIESYAQALYRSGVQDFEAGKTARAEAKLKEAWARHWDFPRPAAFLGYMAYSRGNLKEARRLYALAAAAADANIELAERYRSLPDVKESVRREAALAHMHWGVAAEKLGDQTEAERHYLDSLSRYPLAEARYDIAVLYWNKDRARAAAELMEALKIDPNYQPAAKYLALLRPEL